MKNLLVIFVDSLPYQYALQMPIAKHFSTQLPLTPGFGYSINIQAELFSGKMPDELEYFSEWTYAGTDSPFRKYRMLFNVLSPSSKVYLIDRILHRIGNKIFGPIWNIPFRYLPYLKNQPDIFSQEYTIPSIFTQIPELQVIKYPDFSYPDRDDKMTLAGLTTMETHPQLFIGLVDLDGITHGVGVGSPEYLIALERLNANLDKLLNKYTKLFPDGKMIIVSDHGMANVTGSIELILEKEFGRVNPTSYFYIQDSTMLRIWTFTDKKRKEIEQFLDHQPYGKIVTDDERAKYKLTSSKFGDIIFLLNEGLVFSPSFYGRKLPKAMHGYHPELASQQGVLLYNNPLPSDLGSMQRTTKVYRLISTII
ncbi:MAG: alkaline phosphatase family protein [bacterium]